MPICNVIIHTWYSRKGFKGINRFRIIPIFNFCVINNVDKNIQLTNILITIFEYSTVTDIAGKLVIQSIMLNLKISTTIINYYA